MTPVLRETSEQDEDTPSLWNILFRRQQLQNRLQFLKEVQKRNNRTERSFVKDESPSELERIEEELKLLERKEKELVQKKINQIRSTNVTTQSSELSDGKGPIQGLYVLPPSPTETISPYSLVQEQKTEQRKVPEPSVVLQLEPVPEEILVVNDLSMSSAKVTCPLCQNVVTTEIHYKVGSNAFLFCCLLSVVGCLAGCCLVPFCVNHFKDVTHRCPSCHKDICKVNRI